MYKYGMRLREAAPGAQPKEGLYDIQDDPNGRYWSILLYDRILSDKELEEYELDFISIVL